MVGAKRSAFTSAALETTHTGKCPVCKEKFKYYPRWHRWQANIRGSMKNVCSYHCMRKVEKEIIEKIRCRIEAEDASDADARGKPVVPYLRRRVLDEKTLLAQAKAARKRYIEVENAMTAAKESGEWPRLDKNARGRMSYSRSYWWKRAKALEDEAALYAKKQPTTAAATAE